MAIRGDLSKFDKDLQGAESKTKTLGQRMKGALGGAAIGAAMGAVGAAALTAATKVDSAYDTIRAGTGATGEALDDLKEDFKSVAGSVPDDIGVVGQVIADLNTRTGQTGEGLRNLSEQILDLSRITGTDAPQNVALATRAFGDWSVAVDDQSDTLDMFFRASQQTGIGVDKLMESLVQFGAPLRNIGFDIEDSAAMLGKWEKEGVNTTLALGGLKIALGEFAKEGVDAKEGLAGLIDQIQNAETSAEAMALGVDKFGSRAGPDMVAAIREGRFAFDDYTESIANGTETIATATADTEDFGDKIKGALNTATIALGDFAGPLSGISTAIPGLVMGLPILGGAIGGLASKMGGATAAVGALRSALLLLAGPIGWAIAAVSAFAVAFDQDFLGMKTRFNEDMEDIGRGLQNFAMDFGDMGDTVHSLADEMGTSFEGAKEAIKRDMEETGRTFDQAVYHLRKTKTDWGVEHNEMLEKSEAHWLAMQGITSSGVGRVVTAIEEGEEPIGFAAKLALNDPVLAEMLEAEENANKSGYQVVLEYAKGLLADQSSVQVAIDAAMQIVEEEMSRTEEYAYLSGQLVILEEARGLASAEGKTASIIAIDAAMAAIKERMDVLPGQAYNSGYGVVSSYSQGMWAGMWQITAAANEVASTISRTAKIESEPPDPNSPLRGITKWGGNLVNTLAEGIYGELSTGSAAAQALAGALVPSLRTPAFGAANVGASGAVAGRVNNYYLTVQGKEPVVSSAQEIIHEMTRLESFDHG